MSMAAILAMRPGNLYKIWFPFLGKYGMMKVGFNGPVDSESKMTLSKTTITTTAITTMDTRAGLS